MIKAFSHERDKQKRVNYFRFEFKDKTDKQRRITIPGKSFKEAKSILKSMKEFKEYINGGKNI